MALDWQKRLDTILRRLRLKPLSLAEKCRLQFGGAVLFILTLALLVPYFWMGKLIDKSALDSGRAVSRTMFERHFHTAASKPESPQLPMLTENGTMVTQGGSVVEWHRFSDSQNLFTGLDSVWQRKLSHLAKNEDMEDAAWLDEDVRPPLNRYVRLVRANERCLSCHNPQGSAVVFNKNQKIGALTVRISAQESSRMILLNRLWIVVAGLLAATGAMVAFYAITQRVILRPIRQLRALVNNIAEGNYDVRSAIQTGDEYERLSEAFNHMLDNLMESQGKLQRANQQLDAKIVQLSDKNIELFKANKLKSEFLANMSHEFRTPLNAILGFAELLREKPAADPEKSKRYAENIVSSGRSLLSMINDLLDLAKAEAGKITLHIAKTSIAQLCEGMISFFSPLTEKKQQTIELDADPQVPLIQTDGGKVQQILYNLMSNAIKFTPEGGRICVRVAMLDDTTVRISVIDTGPGISKEDQEKVFEKFRQLDGSITRTTDGTGLGLAISRQLTELLAGSISVQSELGQGATFMLDIPVNLPSPDEKPTATPAA